ncbi:phosphatase [Perkinsus olseni]|uniref:Phosphatase n=1 Tax=Perkinsus olseni TaxID=32597 RepID=A0A7J6QAL7_PEROL|nr:phosphatase [Perkinsus olseni]
MISAQREDSRNTILVHCFAGRSRSVGVLLAYFVLVMRIPFRLAFAHLRRMRPECSPNNGFMQQLAAFEKEVLKNSGPISVSRPSAIFAVENLEEKLGLVVMAAKERLRVMDAELLASPRPLPVYLEKGSEREGVSGEVFGYPRDYVDPRKSWRSKIRLVGMYMMTLIKSAAVGGGLAVLTVVAEGHR